MIAKLIVHGADRTAAIACMRHALDNFKVTGVHTTIPFQHSVLAHSDFVQSRITTRWVEEKFMKQAYPMESAA